MPLNEAMARGGIFGPEDLELLAEVFEATSRSHETDPDREARAGFIVASFQFGIADRDTLIEATHSACQNYMLLVGVEPVRCSGGSAEPIFFAIPAT